MFSFLLLDPTSSFWTDASFVLTGKNGSFFLFDSMIWVSATVLIMNSRVGRNITCPFFSLLSVADVSVCVTTAGKGVCVCVLTARLTKDDSRRLSLPADKRTTRRNYRTVVCLSARVFAECTNKHEQCASGMYRNTCSLYAGGISVVCTEVCVWWLFASALKDYLLLFASDVDLEQWVAGVLWIYEPELF